MKILIVEDEEKLLYILSLYFEKEGFIVDKTQNLKDAIETIKNTKNIDIIILDRMLPDGRGDDLIKVVRENNNNNIPILMLTAKGTEEDRIEGLLLGCDDYVVKPVSPFEIVLRVKAILKRSGKNSESINKIQYRDITLDKDKFIVLVDNSKVDLTKAEFEILFKLIKNKGMVLTRDQLVNAITPEGSFVSDRTIDTHIKNIRKKINRDYIKTVFGLGYKVEDD
jgi:DNA-binding response OmpR family regulator